MNHRETTKKYMVALFAVLMVMFAVSSAFAQETQATITGIVKDEKGGVVVNATVEANSSALIAPRKVTTDSGGAYRMTNLPTGTYDISVSAQGFAPNKQTGLELNAGAIKDVNFTVKVGGQATVMEVTAESQAVDVTSSKVQSTVTSDILQGIPKGRSFQSVIPFAPGSRQEPLQSASGARNNGFQIDGASDSENVYMSDGMDMTNMQVGGVGSNVPMEFVQEVQVKSSSFEAEFGGAVGGVVNVIQKRGGNVWHGSIFTYYSSSLASANDQCVNGAVNSTTCGLRFNPLTTAVAATRLSQGFEYYQQKQDKYRDVWPGFELGGPLWKNHIWLFTSFAPEVNRIRRTVNFTGTNPGLRTFTRSSDTYNSLIRLDYHVFNSLTVYGSWQGGYNKTAGALPATPDSIAGQLNNGAAVDPTSLRSDAGSVNPLGILTLGGDWTPTSKFVVTARYGDFWTNSHTRGTPVGIRYSYDLKADGTTLGLDGTVVPAADQHAAGFNNIAGNSATLFDLNRRRSFSLDGSYFVGHFFGTHNFKVGYSQNRLSNNVLVGFNTALVLLDYAAAYTPGTTSGVTACNSIVNANVALYGITPAASAAAGCRGNYGFAIVRDGVDTNGQVSSINHGIYFQDGWTVGHGLTINAGVRFDKEFLPPYSAGADHIDFGFGSKIAPRIGAAYDLFHNGKVKLYASYGKFFDIMKYSLPRGSFGGEYWHDCVYALDNPDFTLITPSSPGGHGCQASGPAAGVPAAVGRFIENQDFRLNVLSTTDPGVDPNIKPMEQHEMVAGADWSINKAWTFESRYSRKRLDRTIEDIGVTDSLGFYIGNPGSTFADLLHRAEPASGLAVANCPSCPAQPGAIRNYDGLEFRLTRRASDKWFGAVSYTYSRLYGNYSGLTDSDQSDGAGGRHNPNNHRAFDQPEMQFDAHGKVINGPLATDRPHTLKMFGWYRLRWWGMSTELGFDQQIYSGSPISTCIPYLNSTSSCVFVEGRGSFVQLHRDPVTFNIIKDGVINNARMPMFTQTNFNFVHEVKVSKSNDNMKIALEMNVTNALNQRNTLGVFFNPFTSGAIGITKSADPTGFNFASMIPGMDYMAVMNGAAVCVNGATACPLKTLDSRYGQPNLWQAARAVRFKLAFKF